jgi:cyclophilin family peptidyl-prolyl cis-trans isomerase
MWNWRAKNARKQLIKLAPADASIEPLETRALLAGNVVASLNGSHLSVVGDAAANSIEITVLNNQVQLRGLNSTTINGVSNVFVVAANTDTVTGNVSISLGAGNDSVGFSRNVKLNGAVTVQGGDGNDTIAMTGATTRGTVSLFGQAGNDTFSLQDSTTDGFLGVSAGADNDLVSLSNMTLNGPMKITGEGGDDGVSFNDVTSNSYVKMNMGRGNDDVTIRNSSINDSLHIKMKQDEDAVMFDDNTFGGRVHVNLGRDNDGLIVRDTNTFNSLLSVQGGDSRRNGAADFPDGDVVNISSANVLNGGRRLVKTESTTVPTAGNNRFDAANTGLIARATAADTAATNLTSLKLSATATAAADRSLTSSGILITKDANVTISGTTLPGATVTIDADDDGQFDDGTVTADSLGAYTTTVVVTRQDLYTGDSVANDQLNGMQTITLRATLNTETADAFVNVDLIKSTNALVKFSGVTNTGTTEEYFVEMFSAEAPITVTNFLGYSTSGRFDDSIIHRSATTGGTGGTPFVIQGGGFTVDNGVVKSITTDAAITSEFNTARTNMRGTISMAHTGNTNSGTSQWFVNLADNPLNVPTSSTDTTGLRHTVFGRVVGNGMTTVDAIHALTEVDLSQETGASALNEVPLRTTFTDFARTLTGTVTTTVGSTQVVGTGTRFTTELGTSLTGGPRSRIQIGGQSFIVATIIDDTHLTVTVAPTVVSTAVVARADFANDNDFVRFASIAEVLKLT